ncbi:glycosyltransferase family 4 protein [Cupriavidus sp. DB3]|nr:glycosyltransferase family 4 protein [Cupriavidus sp. DB3]MCA7085492.1 glycosyltransferase family 4 protein [Cupriavidus sp. DB3]
MEALRHLLAPAILALLGCAGVLVLLLRTGLAWRLAVDLPNHRSLHTRPTPRVGGWGVTPVSTLLILIFSPALVGVALATLALGLLSHLDDRYGLPARLRFIAHLLAAAGLLWVLPPTATPWLALPLIFALVWLINLYNFMDGADGLAGGMAVFGFGAYAIAASHTQPDLAGASAIVAGAALGFLLFNFPPAKVFLGDSGSIPLGFLAGGLGYWGWHTGAWSWWFPMMVFLPFIADASITLLRRLLQGERFWEAHRQHYYQRMIQMRGAHRGIVLRWYGLMLCSTFVAFCAMDMPRHQAIAAMAAWVGAVVALGWNVDRQWRRFSLRRPDSNKV